MNRYVIISPCYNEEKVITVFLSELEETFSKTDCNYTVVIVDDCSTDESLMKLKSFKFQSQNYELKVIRLKYNVGHQEAIRQGLKFASTIDATGYIVMDSDGEDDPEAIRKLVEPATFEIIFVSRGKRRETISFKIGYYFYKILFKIISGNNIHFGNYSIISKKVLASIHNQNFDHYSAFLSKLKFNKDFLTFDRRKRIGGKSKMNINNLVLHGLKSLIEYSEELLFFFIRLLLLMFIAFFIFGGYVLYSYFISHFAIPGWSSNIALGLINSILITSGIIILGLLIVSQRNRTKFQNDIYTEI